MGVLAQTPKKEKGKAFQDRGSCPLPQGRNVNLPKKKQRDEEKGGNGAELGNYIRVMTEDRSWRYDWGAIVGSGFLL